MAESCSEREKFFPPKQATVYYVAAKSMLKKLFQEIARVLESMATVHAHALQTHDSETNRFKELVASSKKRWNDVRCKRNGARV